MMPTVSQHPFLTRAKYLSSWSQSLTSSSWANDAFTNNSNAFIPPSHALGPLLPSASTMCSRAMVWSTHVEDPVSSIAVLPSGAFVTGSREMIQKVGTSARRGALLAWDCNVQLGDLSNDFMKPKPVSIESWLSN